MSEKFEYYKCRLYMLARENNALGLNAEIESAATDDSLTNAEYCELYELGLALLRSL